MRGRALLLRVSQNIFRRFWLWCHKHDPPFAAQKAGAHGAPQKCGIVLIIGYFPAQDKRRNRKRPRRGSGGAFRILYRSGSMPARASRSRRTGPTAVTASIFSRSPGRKGSTQAARAGARAAPAWKQYQAVPRA